NARRPGGLEGAAPQAATPAPGESGRSSPGRMTTVAWGATSRRDEARNAFLSLHALPRHTPTALPVSTDRRLRKSRWCSPGRCVQWVAGCGRPRLSTEEPMDIDRLAASLRAHVERLAATPRVPGTDAHHQARAYIQGHLERAGFAVEEVN